MPIHLPRPLEPFMGTEEDYKAYIKVVQLETFTYIAYRNTIGIFSLFSPRRNREYKQALAKWQKAYDDYNKRVWGTNS